MLAPELDRPTAAADFAQLGHVVTDVLLKLLSAAGEAVERDKKTARACIDRASALLESHRESPSDPRAETQGLQPLTPWQHRRVMEFIEENLDRPIRIVELARVARLTSSYFSRCFRGSTGHSPQAFLARRRMELAQELMLTTDEPLSQIALACGLSDQAHLSRTFARIHGTSPGAWRRDRRGCLVA